MDVWGVKRGLAALILLLVRTHPAGFRVLLGEYPEPDGLEIHNMLRALDEDADPEMRVDGGGRTLPEAVRVVESAERFEAIVRQAGGWGHIRRVTGEWAQNYEATWRMVVDHAKWVCGGFSRLDSSQLDRVARMHGVSRDTVWRRVREFPAALAAAILAEPGEE